MRNPDTGTTNLSYDEARNLASRIDEKGQVIDYSYDALNRLSRVETSDPSEPDVVFTYDEASAAFGIGRLTAVNDGNGIRRYDYTPQGLVATETWEISGLTLTPVLQRTFARPAAGFFVPASGWRGRRRPGPCQEGESPRGIPSKGRRPASVMRRIGGSSRRPALPFPNLSPLLLQRNCPVRPDS